MTSHDTFLKAWVAAERDGDTATTDRLLTDDFLAIGPLGFALDRPAWLRRPADGLAYDEVSLSETTTRTYGGTRGDRGLMERQRVRARPPRTGSHTPP